jgi:hypothetical protein
VLVFDRSSLQIPRIKNDEIVRFLFSIEGGLVLSGCPEAVVEDGIKIVDFVVVVIEVVVVEVVMFNSRGLELVEALLG